MGKTPTEILIYNQKLKKYLKEDPESYNYFLKGVDEDLFFKHLYEVSIRNFKEFGDPTLSRIQFELLNKTIKAICAVNSIPYNIWWDLSIDSLGIIKGKICLN